MNKTAILLAVIIMGYLLCGVCAIRSQSITFDEGPHYIFGIRILKGNPVRPKPVNDNSKMPVSVLNVLPRGAAQLLHPQLHKSDYGQNDIISGRYITLLFSVCSILLVFWWSKNLYGNNAGLFSAFLFACCPNNQAASMLVTTDAYAVFFLLATMYCLWKYCNSKSTKDFIFFAVLLGVSQLVKQSLFHLYVLAPLCMLMYALVNREKMLVKPVALKIITTAFISWLIINAGFTFYKTVTPLGGFHFMSNLFQSLQQALPTGFPVPVSASFVEGLDQAKFYDQLGGGFEASSFGNVNILGHSTPGSSFWYYYFITLLFKTPLSCILIIMWALFLYLRNCSVKQFVKQEFFLWAPVLYFLLYMSFLYKTQCGVRHIIFVYPLLYIFCGSIFQHIKSKLQWTVLVLLIAGMLPGLFKYRNNYYPYTNELITDKTNAYNIVGAGNLNFGQAWFFLNDFLRKNPDISYAPGKPAKGKFVIVVDDFVDIWNTGKYKWLQHYAPAGQVAYSYLLFDIK